MDIFLPITLVTVKAVKMREIFVKCGRCGGFVKNTKDAGDLPQNGVDLEPLFLQNVVIAQL